uniref:Uncharacterized protein n=1 Tax=Anguilla anguilla TaxID=7936 RepID=A0A0E9X8X3_ANGAN
MFRALLCSVHFRLYKYAFHMIILHLFCHHIYNFMKLWTKCIFFQIGQILLITWLTFIKISLVHFVKIKHMPCQK